MNPPKKILINILMIVIVISGFLASCLKPTKTSLKLTIEKNRVNQDSTLCQYIITDPDSTNNTFGVLKISECSLPEGKYELVKVE